MKKLFSLIFLFAICLTLANAQTGTTVTLPKGQQFYEFTGLATDYSTTSPTATWTKDVLIKNIPERVNYNIQLKVHKLSSGQAAIKLQGKVFSTDTYTDITTVGYAGGQDSVINFTNTLASSQPVLSAYRYFRVSNVATADSVRVTWIKYSFKK